MKVSGKLKFEELENGIEFVTFLSVSSEKHQQFLDHTQRAAPEYTNHVIICTNTWQEEGLQTMHSVMGWFAEWNPGTLKH